jgi:hypothetical protein
MIELQRVGLEFGESRGAASFGDEVLKLILQAEIKRITQGDIVILV